jgi:predicted acyl esterase
MKKVLIRLVTLLLLFEPNASIYSASIPNSLKPLYQYLETTLNTNQRWVESLWDGKIYPDFKPKAASSNRIPYSVPMRDGEKLAGDLYTLNPAEPKPVILIQTPYDKSKYWTQFEQRIPFSLEHYNIFITDWRGRFASSTAKKTKSNNATDGYDVVEWIAKQVWSNGKIGTYGGSALGDVQFKTASMRPPHLVCAVPMVKDYRVDYNTYYFGGEYRKEQIAALEFLQFLKTDTILAQPVMNQYWKTVEKLTDLASTFSVPMLLITGWFDHYPDKVIRAFSDISEKSSPEVRAKHKLIIGPWEHGNLGDIKQGSLSYPGAEGFDDKEAIRFMDYYLRGIKNSWELTPTVQYYQMGEETWQKASSWKQIPREELSFYLQPSHKLGTSTVGCKGFSDSYLYDPSKPTPSYGGKRFDPRNPFLISGPQDQREKVESRSDVLLYTSDPLPNNLPINGLIRTEIYFSSSQLDTDISVRFCDVYPDGRSILMAEGIRRARFRNSLEKEELLVPEQIYKVTVELQNISLTVLKGHQIRVIVSSASYPIFERNPNNGGKLYKDNRLNIALNTIYHDFNYPSRIILPIRK